MQREYHLIMLASRADLYVVLFTFSNSKFNIGVQEKSYISDHVKIAKHITGAQKVQGNQSFVKLAVDKQDPAEKIFKRKNSNLSST